MMIEKHTQHPFSKVEIKDYHVMIDGQNFLNKPGKGDLRTHHNIQKTENGQGDGYRNGCLLDYPYFKKHYKIIPIDALDADSKAMQEISFAGNLNQDGNTTLLFIIEEAKN